ncbi:MAG: Fic family protein [Actinomycetota bacterium]
MRPYEESHPWIAFNARALNEVHPRLWMLLGEARSKCEHLAGAPLKPEIAKRFYRVTLIKGAQATTAIEGNTLSEEQVAGILDGSFEAPPSRRYQEIEVRNVLDALTKIDAQVQHGEYPKLTRELLCDFNRQVLVGLEDQLDDSTVAGEVRTHSVVVGRYRGAPSEDCEYLLDRLGDWLEGPDFKAPDRDIDFALMLVRAVLAHLYIAWIHPFGDGNGRTARLVEFLILARSGKVPLPAAHLLSNHYNLTRDRYYRELDKAGKSGGDITGFITYAIEGFVDGIRSQIDEVRMQQLSVAWINFVHEVMSRFPTGKASDRQRELVLAMPVDRAVPRSELTGLTPRLALQYAQTGPRTLSRDLNRLEGADLITRVGRNNYRASAHQMAAFLPAIAPADNEDHST